MLIGKVEDGSILDPISLDYLLTSVLALCLQCWNKYMRAFNFKKSEGFSTLKEVRAFQH